MDGGAIITESRQEVKQAEPKQGCSQQELGPPQHCQVSTEENFRVSYHDPGFHATPQPGSPPFNPLSILGSIFFTREALFMFISTQPAT